MPLLTCENLSLAYEGTVVASDINFSVNGGNYLCIVGENGSGKSTLVKGILGLIQPHSGKIVFDGGLKRTEIGYLPQQTQLQKDFPASVFEVVLSGRLNSRGIRPFYSREDKCIAHENMALLGISGLSDCSFGELSGGQRQRVLLSRALCAAKKLLLLDEPVAGLDPISAKDMYETISMLRAEKSMSVIMISHDIETAVYYSTHILHLHKTPEFFGTSEDYIKSDIGRRFAGGVGNG